MAANYSSLSNDIAATMDVPFATFADSPDLTKVEAIHIHICSENYDAEYKLAGITARDGGTTVVPEANMLSLVLAGVCLIRMCRFRFSPREIC